MKIAILTSPNQWFVPYAKKMKSLIENSKLFYDYKAITDSFDIVFILGYHQIIPESYLQRHKHNIVIHESKLPQGKGWAPMFWQILEGKNEIPFTMFKASDSIDNGNIYMTESLSLTGYELHDELRDKQALFSIEMCLKFINQYEKYRIPFPQKGKESFYAKRSSRDSELDINKTIEEQFNLLRIVSNIDYPAFFELHGNKYKITIKKMED